MTNPNYSIVENPAVLGVGGGQYLNPAVRPEDSLGFIQSRGLGDLIIALPIAHYYRLKGKTIYWPICEEFFPTMSQAAPWVNWIPMKTDPVGKFFWDSPQLALKYIVPQDNIINLMQFLSSRPQDSDPDIFPILKFDQYKYAAAGVPFLWKWRLSECIQRDLSAEQALYTRLVKKSKYIVVHLTGSDRRIDLDFSDAHQKGYQVIEIQEGLTANAFNWLKILEGAEALYLLDSCFANMVDQLDLGADKTFIRRSKMDLTPVLGSDWSYMSP